LLANDKKTRLDQKRILLPFIKALVSTLLLLTGTVMAAGTLSGTVVDAADGETPVYPVIVALIDPVTGEDPPGLDAATDSDGFYEITAIPPGDYKVHFNAVNTASGYVDELYDGIPCENGGCGMAVLGDVLNFVEGSNVLNIDLERRPTLSGRVTDDRNIPFVDVAVEVLDESGSLVDGQTFTDSDGEWIKNVPALGTYYVRTVGEWTPGYLPEIWNNISCDGCDPVATGDPIEVMDADVGGIDFQLEPTVKLLGILSGLVIDAADGVTPVYPVEIDLINPETGDFLGISMTNYPDGSWQMHDLEQGSYKVLFNAFNGAEAFADELYDDVFCDNGSCDRSALGHVVSLGTADIELEIDLRYRDDYEPPETEQNPIICELFENKFRAVHLGSNAASNFRSATEFDIPESFLQELKDLNVNWIGIMQSLHLDDSLDSSVEFKVQLQEFEQPAYSDEQLSYLVDTFQAHGFNVYVTLAFETKAAAQTEHPFSRSEMGAPFLHPNSTVESLEFWPWSPKHPDHVQFIDEFWTTYTQRAVELAVFLESKGIQLFSLGTETRDLFRTRTHQAAGYTNHFRSQILTMVQSVREVYSGAVTYDMHGNQFKWSSPMHDFIWDDLDLDIIGVSAYFDYLVDSLPTTITTVQTLENSWDDIFNDYLIPARRRNSNRPMLFLEGAYTNSIGAPYDSHHMLGQEDSDNNGNGVNDGEETQANIYRAFFNIIDRYPNDLNGVFIWNYFMESTEDWYNNHLSRNKIDLGPRGKLGDQVVREVYEQWKGVSPSETVFKDSFEGCNF